jgi:hypothetical protein
MTGVAGHIDTVRKPLALVITIAAPFRMEGIVQPRVGRKRPGRPPSFWNAAPPNMSRKFRRAVDESGAPTAARFLSQGSSTTTITTDQVAWPTHFTSLLLSTPLTGGVFTYKKTYMAVTGLRTHRFLP